jgi:hypothetical protein
MLYLIVHVYVGIKTYQSKNGLIFMGFLTFENCIVILLPASADPDLDLVRIH